MRGIEIAFAGRSNVGKSSLINALTSRKALARTSHTPGRTQELIFFRAGPARAGRHAGLRLCRRAPKTKIAAWTGLIDAYLRGRANLARVYVLIDARHGLKDDDDNVLEELGASAVSYQIVLTKCDAIKPTELDGADRRRRSRAGQAAGGASRACWRPRRARHRNSGTARRDRAAAGTNSGANRSGRAGLSAATHIG